MFQRTVGGGRKAFFSVVGITKSQRAYATASCLQPNALVLQGANGVIPLFKRLVHAIVRNSLRKPEQHIGLGKRGSVNSVAPNRVVSGLVKDSPVQGLLWKAFGNQHTSNVTEKLKSVFCAALRGRRHLGIFSVALLGFTLAEYDATSFQKPSLASLVELFQSTADEKLQNSSSYNSIEYSADVRDYSFQDRLGKISSCGAVYASECKGKECAVKILFNFGSSSDSETLYQGFRQEYEVLFEADPKGLSRLQGYWPGRDKLPAIPPHPNIIRILQAFAAPMPCLYDSKASYPAALPQVYQGFGRSRTMFLVMPRYQFSLREFLQKEGCELPHLSRMYLLMQLFEGLAHLREHRVAHRDLKSDNILVTCERDHDSPALAITDFGHCLYEESGDLCLKYETYQIPRGGNPALLAPEIICATPRVGAVLDYRKSDVWAAGTLAYEIFGQENPFYNLLENRFYADDDVPMLDSRNPGLSRIVKGCLRKDPTERLTARQVADALFLIVHAPAEWSNVENATLPSLDDINRWLVHSWIQLLRRDSTLRRTGGEATVQDKLLLCFLAKATDASILEALRCIHEA